MLLTMACSCSRSVRSVRDISAGVDKYAKVAAINKELGKPH